MAFLSRAGNLLKQATTSKPALFQAIRCMSSSKLFVGGLPWSTNSDGLRNAFASYGQVIEAKVIEDKETLRSRGFGFVTFQTVEEAAAAMTAMDGQEIEGRPVRVNYANDRPSFGGGGGGGGGGYGGYGGGRGGGYGRDVGGGYGGGEYGGGGYGRDAGAGDVGNFYRGNASYGSDSAGGFNLGGRNAGRDGLDSFGGKDDEFDGKDDDLDDEKDFKFDDDREDDDDDDFANKRR